VVGELTRPDPVLHGARAGVVDGHPATAPDRIRVCAHEACVLHFFDTSRNGTRRWCSMAACGNRAKAFRHYARTKDA
jgi:predicted RNA-binding Zn ribbon-like protein